MLFLDPFINAEIICSLHVSSSQIVINMFHRYVIEWDTSKEGTVFQLPLDYILNLMMLSGLMILIHRGIYFRRKII
jgi:hypothetical protein